MSDDPEFQRDDGRADTILRAMADELRDGRATPSHQLLLDHDIRSHEILGLMELAADGIETGCLS